MAAKDADLARDFSLDFVYISMPTVAAMEVELATTPLMSAGDRTAELFLVGIPEGGGAVYRMRAYDTDLSRTVYWDAVDIATADTEYTGNSLALTNIVVSAAVC